MRNAEYPPRDDLLELYVRQASQFPLLSAAKEKELGILAQAGDHEAAQQLIVSNLRLVIKIVHRYRGTTLSTLDLIQAGNIGLMHAVSKFQPRKGFKLSTYATFWIRSSIERSIRQYDIIRQPRYVGEQVTRLLKAQEVLTHQLRRPPTRDELGEVLQLDGRALENVLRAYALFTAVDSMHFNDYETENAKDSVDVATDAVNHLLTERIRALVDDLPVQQQRIIKLRFGFENGHCYTYTEIARHVGLSCHAVRRVCRKTLDQLQQSAEWQDCQYN